MEMLLLLALNGCSISKLAAMEGKNVAPYDSVSQACGTELTNSCAELHVNQFLPCGSLRFAFQVALSIWCGEQMCISNIWYNQKNPEDGRVDSAHISSWVCSILIACTATPFPFLSVTSECPISFLARYSEQSVAVGFCCHLSEALFLSVFTFSCSS